MEEEKTTYRVKRTYSAVREFEVVVDASSPEEASKLANDQFEEVVEAAVKHGELTASLDQEEVEEYEGGDGGPPYDAATATGMYDRD